MSGSSYLEKRLSELRGSAQTPTYTSNTIGGTRNVQTKTYVVGNTQQAPTQTRYLTATPQTSNVKYIGTRTSSQSPPQRIRVVGSTLNSTQKPTQIYTQNQVITSNQPRVISTNRVSSSPVRVQTIGQYSTSNIPTTTYTQRINTVPVQRVTQVSTPQYQNYRPENRNYELLTNNDMNSINSNIRNELNSNYAPSNSLQSPYYDRDAEMSRIRDLKNNLRSQVDKTQHLNKKFIADLQDLDRKRIQQESHIHEKKHEHDGLDKEVNQLESDSRRVEEIHDTLSRENTGFRENLIGLGEKTNQTVAELDTKLNGSLRMKSHQVENAKFEMETADNEFIVICTEMDKDYGEKFKEIEMKIREAKTGKDKGERDLKDISEKVRNLHRETERRARQVVDTVKQEAARNLDDARKELDARVKGVEQATRTIKTKDEAKVRDIQDMDRTIKNREMALKSEFSRLKMDLERFTRDNYQLESLADNMGKELGVKESDYARADMDKKIYEEKLDELKGYMQKDFDKIREEILVQEKIMKDDLINIERQSVELDEMIRDSNQRYDDLRAQYDSLMDRLHSGLESTLNKEIDSYNRGVGTTPRESRI